MLATYYHCFVSIWMKLDSWRQVSWKNWNMTSFVANFTWCKSTIGNIWLSKTYNGTICGRWIMVPLEKKCILHTFYTKLIVLHLLANIFLHLCTEKYQLDLCDEGIENIWQLFLCYYHFFSDVIYLIQWNILNVDLKFYIL